MVARRYSTVTRPAWNEEQASVEEGLAFKCTSAAVCRSPPLSSECVVTLHADTRCTVRNQAGACVSFRSTAVCDAKLSD
eukprot:3933694-Rhodomonas_salina.1